MRITDTQLNAMIERLNVATDSPTTYAANAPGEKFRAAIGHFHADYGYGGARLVRTVNEAGGITSCTGSGYGTKRQCYDAAYAMLRGVSLESVSTLQAHADADRRAAPL